MCSGYLPDEFETEETSDTMDELLSTRQTSRQIQKSYKDRRNTLTWALLIWAFTAVGFALFLPFDATMLRSVGVAVGWSAIHLIRRM